MKVTIRFRPGSESRQYWRVKHKIEGGWQNTPPGMPEVLPPDNPGVVAMTPEIQQMSYALMTRLNPTITKTQWTRVHDYDRAFNNFNGFNNDRDPRANYILGENLGAPLPKYDKAQRVCGGSLISGRADGDWLYCAAGVDGIDASQPLPTVDEIIARSWYILAVSVNNDFTKISHFPQGNGGVVAIPFIFSGVIRFPLYCFERWTQVERPDPLKIYL